MLHRIVYIVLKGGKCAESILIYERNVEATKYLSGMCCRVGASRRFAKFSEGLGNRVPGTGLRTYPYFEISVNMLQ